MRRLRRNHLRSFPDRILILDVESSQSEEGAFLYQSMRIAWTCFLKWSPKKNHWLEYWTYHTRRKLLMSYIESLAVSKKPLWILAHNIFYDLQSSGFFRSFARRGWSREFYYDKGITYILTCTKGDRKIKCVSTTNYFPDALSVMGRAVGLEKYDVDPFTEDEDLLSVYCFRDVEILVETIKSYVSFIQDHDLGRFALTRASQAMLAFRHRFMDDPMYVHHEEPVFALEKAAYYGGRTEAFFIGSPSGGPFTSLDINSMYPHQMRERSFPTRLIAYHERGTVKRLSELLGRFTIIAHVWIDTDVPLYAYRKDDKIIFPIGRFDTYVCTQGLQEAIRRRHVKRIGEYAVYDHAPVFRTFIDYFYSLRVQFKREGNALYDKFAKYLMNSLYGKFGQQVAVETSREDMTYDGYYRKSIYDAPTKTWIYETKLLNVATVEANRVASSTTIAAIAAHVTEYARFALWRIIETVGRSRVLYCDTDSVKLRVRDIEKADQLIDSNKLGALKREENFSRFHIYGLKDYVQDDKVVLKGVPSRAAKLAPDKYRYDSFQRQASHLRLQEDDRYVLRRITKTLKREYTKGTVTKTGRVRPLRLKTF